MVGTSLTDGEDEKISEEAVVKALEDVNLDDEGDPDGEEKEEEGGELEEEETEGRDGGEQLPAPISEELQTPTTFALWEGGPVVDRSVSDEEVERLFQDAMRRAVENVDWDDEEDDIGPPIPTSPNSVEKQLPEHKEEEEYLLPDPASDMMLTIPASSQFVEEAPPVGKPLSYLEINGGSKLRIMENYDDWTYEEGDESNCPIVFTNSYAGEPPTHTSLPQASTELAVEYRARESEVITDMYLRMRHWWEKGSYMTVHKAARIRSALYIEYWEGYDPYE